MAKVSVIVPIYNVEKYLKRCLESIINQSYQDYEVLCVNDCTPDNSMDIVDEFVSQYPNKVRRIDNEQNMGLGAAREQGMKQAMGQYLVFFDSDDYVKTDYLETYVAEMERTGADIVLGGYIRVVGETQTTVSMIDTEYTPWLYPAVWMRMYRKSFLDSHGIDFRGIRIYEDNPFNFRCMLEGAKVSIINYSGYYYMCNPASITKSQNGVAKYERYMGNFCRVYEEYKNSDGFQKYYNQMEYAYLSATLSSMLLHSQHAGKENAFHMYYDYKEKMQKMFPNYKKSKGIGFFKLKEELLKVRVATTIFMMAEKLGMGKWMIRLLAI